MANPVPDRASYPFKQKKPYLIGAGGGKDRVIYNYSDGSKKVYETKKSSPHKPLSGDKPKKEPSQQTYGPHGPNPYPKSKQEGNGKPIAPHIKKDRW